MTRREDAFHIRQKRGNPVPGQLVDPGHIMRRKIKYLVWGPHSLLERMRRWARREDRRERNTSPSSSSSTPRNDCCYLVLSRDKRTRLCRDTWKIEREKRGSVNESRSSNKGNSPSCFFVLLVPLSLSLSSSSSFFSSRVYSFVVSEKSEESEDVVLC